MLAAHYINIKLCHTPSLQLMMDFTYFIQDEQRGTGRASPVTSATAEILNFERIQLSSYKRIVHDIRRNF
jgi:hypothetical protein